MDVICQAKSGMGKTAVFVLSTLQQINPVAGQVAALVPYKRIGLPDIKIAAFCGRVHNMKHKDILKNDCLHIVAGTPRRVLVLARHKDLNLKNVMHFILDECDKMLESLALETWDKAAFHWIVYPHFGKVIVIEQKTGTGYLSAFPPDFLTVWKLSSVRLHIIPFISADHGWSSRLIYIFTGNVKALQMVVGMADYFGNRVKNDILKYSIERYWVSLNEETDGLNDILYRLFSYVNLSLRLFPVLCCQNFILTLFRLGERGQQLDSSATSHHLGDRHGVSLRRRTARELRVCCDNAGKFRVCCDGVGKFRVCSDGAGKFRVCCGGAGKILGLLWPKDIATQVYSTQKEEQRRLVLAIEKEMSLLAHKEWRRPCERREREKQKSKRATREGEQREEQEEMLSADKDGESSGDLEREGRLLVKDPLVFDVVAFARGEQREERDWERFSHAQA
ncbi:hypothetical protein ZIOFF_019900 [Zingiber officinale]|uniref:Helicase ATP-binding domain-containing protein n=1 Tax=Zingiber officinale TaxID=94328 RepID=A0A8J5LPA1_ZINOF|nr:hypothetical protein ZIOFF_019900 [Zingiber officinale]